jgi:hypothetical protein
MRKIGIKTIGGKIQDWLIEKRQEGFQKFEL